MNIADKTLFAVRIWPIMKFPFEDQQFLTQITKIVHIEA